MRALVDSSVVLRYLAYDEPKHARVVESIEELLSQGHMLAVTPQVIRECWSVMTRPKELNGLGLSPASASDLMVAVTNTFVLMDDTQGIYGEWHQLVTEHQVSGKQVHDANHVAAMIIHQLDSVMTLDVRDFQRYRQIAVIAIP